MVSHAAPLYCGRSAFCLGGAHQGDKRHFAYRQRIDAAHLGSARVTRTRAARALALLPRRACVRCGAHSTALPRAAAALTPPLCALRHTAHCAHAGLDGCKDISGEGGAGEISMVTLLQDR